MKDNEEKWMEGGEDYFRSAENGTSIIKKQQQQQDEDDNIITFSFE